MRPTARRVAWIFAGSGSAWNVGVLPYAAHPWATSGSSGSTATRPVDVVLEVPVGRMRLGEEGVDAGMTGVAELQQVAGSHRGSFPTMVRSRTTTGMRRVVRRLYSS